MNFKATILFVTLYFISSLSFSQTLHVYLMKDLNFGDVFIGYSEDVRYDDEQVAEFIVYHTSSYSRDLLISFNLPNSLTNGTDQLPILFKRRHAAWSYGRDGTQRRFNPNNPLERRRLIKNSQLFIRLGGEVKAENNNLSPGRYSDTIILTVEYL
ncbi:MAG: hypothetical protein GY936_00955 [Ignavibacteriae bacterium]|nr:hypothetical protein [Ignavibacteriota bacterium]